MSEFPEWFDSMMDDVLALENEGRAGRRKAQWHEPAFKCVDELVSAGTSINEACKR